MSRSCVRGSIWWRRYATGDGVIAPAHIIRAMAQVLATIGVVGVLAAVAIAVGGVVDWGPPGSPEYATYALINRLTGVALALGVAAPLSLWRALADKDEAVGVRRSLVVLAVAMGGMVVGSVAEFWAFNDQPYQGPGSEGRNVAWMTFLLSGLVAVAGSVVAGILLLRRAVVPRWAGFAVASAAPIGIAAATFGASPFLAVPLIALALCVTTLALGRRSPISPRIS